MEFLVEHATITLIPTLTKIYTTIDRSSPSFTLQEDINTCVTWSPMWQLPFNIFTWNDLPNEVICAKSTDEFKMLMDYYKINNMYICN